MPGATVLVVVRIDFGASTDTMRLYVNPTPGVAEPATADATISYNLGHQNGLALQSNLGGGSQLRPTPHRHHLCLDVTPTNGVVVNTALPVRFHHGGF